eukprot:Skav235657  [mRNA]  locus=scaffold358:776854:781271:+ [translate_table: standard]
MRRSQTGESTVAGTPSSIAISGSSISSQASVRKGQRSCLPPGHWLREHERFAYNLEDLDLLAVYLELSKAGWHRSTNPAKHGEQVVTVVVTVAYS